MKLFGRNFETKDLSIFVFTLLVGATIGYLMEKYWKTNHAVLWCTVGAALGGIRNLFQKQ